VLRPVRACPELRPVRTCSVLHPVRSEVLRMVWTALIKSVNTTGKNQQQIMQVGWRRRVGAALR